MHGEGNDANAKKMKFGVFSIHPNFLSAFDLWGKHVQKREGENNDRHFTGNSKNVAEEKWAIFWMPRPLSALDSISRLFGEKRGRRGVEKRATRNSRRRISLDRISSICASLPKTWALAQTQREVPVE